MTSAKITIAVGIALLAGVVAFALTRSPPRVVQAPPPANSAKQAILGSLSGDAAVCQTNEALPAGISAIRIHTWTFFGSRVEVAVYGRRGLLTSGSRGPDWTGQTVTVPVTPVKTTAANVVLCFAIGPNSEPFLLVGNTAAPDQRALAWVGGDRAQPYRTPATRVPGRLTVEYLADGNRSWWSRILATARHMGLGRAFSGTWIALLAAALTAAVALLAVRLAWRELP